jgi:hypothetical protein
LFQNQPTFIFSTGHRDTSGSLPKIAAYISVSPPTLPKNISNMLAIQKARIYVGVNNLLTISGYNKYGDPECGSGSVLYQGLDTGRYPQPRTWMAGINVTF